MHFRTRAFLCCFVPVALLLASSFWMIQRLVQSTVRDELRTSLRDNHEAVARERGKSQLQSGRILRVVGENAALKAGVRLLLAYPGNGDARRTVEDQLRELCERMDFDLFMVSGPDGMPLAGVLRNAGNVDPIDTAKAKVQQQGLTLLNNHAYQIASVPLDQGDENIGSLSVGQIFDLSEFTTPVALFHGGRLVKSSLAGIAPHEVQDSLGSCLRIGGECDLQLRGVNYISLPMSGIPLGDGYVLRSLQNVDTAMRPVQRTLRRVFASVALIAVIVALVFSMASAGSIARPIAIVVERLKEANKTGDLVEFRSSISRVPEIQGLTESFNRAVAAIRDGRENLHLAYVGFVRSLASALDARDEYTAGHSHRVSELSSAVAIAMGLPVEAVERVRVGALLHDIGKIGVADGVLRKPGRLTEEEFALVKLHPEIGRRILEGVSGFQPYLAAVELHHENWDGSGYPHGQMGEETPVDARIIHVTDAYDAMTTDRPYRRGMTHDEAIRLILRNAGTQFDAEIVRQFIGLPFCNAPDPVYEEPAYQEVSA